MATLKFFAIGGWGVQKVSAVESLFRCYLLISMRATYVAFLCRLFWQILDIIKSNSANAWHIKETNIS